MNPVKLIFISVILSSFAAVSFAPNTAQGASKKSKSKKGNTAAKCSKQGGEKIKWDSEAPAKWDKEGRRWDRIALDSFLEHPRGQKFLESNISDASEFGACPQWNQMNVEMRKSVIAAYWEGMVMDAESAGDVDLTCDGKMASTGLTQVSKNDCKSIKDVKGKAHGSMSVADLEHPVKNLRCGIFLWLERQKSDTDFCFFCGKAKDAKTGPGSVYGSLSLHGRAGAKKIAKVMSKTCQEVYSGRYYQSAGSRKSFGRFKGHSN